MSRELLKQSLEIQKLVDVYNITSAKLSKQPTISKIEISFTENFNPDYDQDAECICGHTYDRHFDGYDFDSGWESCVSCKYCRCREFTPK